MAKEKKEKRCKECEGMGKDCKCPPKSKKGKLGYYGLEKDYDDEKDMADDHPMNGGMEGGAGGMSEGIKMPEAPSDADKSMQGMSSEKKKKKLKLIQLQHQSLISLEKVIQHKIYYTNK